MNVVGRWDGFAYGVGDHAFMSHAFDRIIDLVLFYVYGLCFHCGFRDPFFSGRQWGFLCRTGTGKGGGAVSAYAYAFTCNCCKQHGVQMRVPHDEVDLGIVCEPCRELIRLAHARLKRGGFVLCSHVADLHERRALIGVKKGGAR